MSTIVTNYSKHGDIDKYIYQNHNKKEQYLQYREKWEKSKENEDLLFLLLETTYKCNFVCPMCIHSQGYKKAPYMTNELFEMVLQEIEKNKIPSISMSQINEPLLDKEIVHRISAVSRIDSVVDIHMNTNASLLNEEMSLKILESGLTRLLIGYDGFSKETYEAIRVGGNFDKVTENILNFLKLKKELKKVFPVVRISFVRTSLNEHEVEDWYNFWKDKVDYISIQEFKTQSEEKSDLQAESTERKKINHDEITCNEPFERLVIRGDGAVLPCCAFEATEMPVGNIKDLGLSDIWHGKKMKDMRQMFIDNTWRKNEICKRCLEISYGINE